MLVKVNTSEFRKHLKDYFTKAMDDPSCTFLVGDVLVLSPDALCRLQERHAVNVQIRDQYHRLKLDNYLTLVNGTVTKDLPLDALLALSCIFRLLGELTDTLARCGAKENASKWDVTEYVKAAAVEKPCPDHGRFSTVYMAIQRLFQPEWFDLEETETLLDFFSRAGTLASWELREKKQCLKWYDMTKEQLRLVAGIVKDLCEWGQELIEFQKLDQGHMGSGRERVLISYHQIEQWYAENVGKNED